MQEKERKKMREEMSFFLKKRILFIALRILSFSSYIPSKKFKLSHRLVFTQVQQFLPKACFRKDIINKVKQNINKLKVEQPHTVDSRYAACGPLVNSLQSERRNELYLELNLFTRY